MRLIIILSLTFLFAIPQANTQEEMLKLPADEVVTTQHSTTIKGQTINYTAQCGTQPVWDKDGNITAALFYTYYTRDGVKDRSERPLFISFNGGPGSASVWMHMAYTGPVILNVDEEGFPVQPYGIKQNPYSILDVADIVFVNPVNTGYSRILDDSADREGFFGVKADIKYLAEWINTFVSRNNRWLSPKYLIGESYGTTRVSGLALELQDRQWMYLNGVILVSPTELGIKRDGPVEAANRLPYYAATAWYHEALPAELQGKDLMEVLEEAEEYTIHELIPVLAKGGFITAEERAAAAKKMAYYSGLSEKEILQNNLDVSTSYFWKALLRERGYTVGRLDSRYLGLDERDAGSRPDYNSELKSWLHSFTPSINYYLRQELKFETDLQYNMFGPVRPWDRSKNNTGKNLRQAMAQNPYLNVLIQSGYYDGATSYFDAKYTMWQLDPSGKMRDRLHFEGYRSGHMMYLRKEDLEASNEHLREFIKVTLPAKNQAAKY